VLTYNRGKIVEGPGSARSGPVEEKPPSSRLEFNRKVFFGSDLGQG
jgi:hypothetical protein